MEESQAAIPAPRRRIIGTANAAIVVAAIVGFYGSLVFTCACGHIHAWGLTVTGTVAAVAWWAFMFGGSTHPVWRLIRVGIVVLSTVLVTKNLSDVLWFGHDPVFSEIPAIFGG